MKLQDITSGQLYAQSKSRDPWEYKTDSDKVFVADSSGRFASSGKGGYHGARIWHDLKTTTSAERRVIIVKAEGGEYHVADHLDELRAWKPEDEEDFRDGRYILDGRFRAFAVRAQTIVAPWEEFQAAWETLEASQRKQREDADARMKTLTEARAQIEADLASKGLTSAHVDMQSGRVHVNLKQLQDLLASI